MPRWVFWLRSLMALMIMPVVFVLAVAVMVVERDIAAPTWVSDRIAARVNAALIGYTLSVDQIVVRIDRTLHPTLRFFDVDLIDAGGLTVSRVPLVEGEVSPRGLILEQSFLVQKLRVFGPQIAVRRDRSGALSFQFRDGSTRGQTAPSVPALLQQVSTVFDQPALAALEQAEATGVVLNYDDAFSSRSWIVDGGSVRLSVQRDALQLRSDFTLLSGGAEPSRVTASYDMDRRSLAADLALTLSNVPAADLGSQIPALRWLDLVDAPISGAMRTSLDGAGTLGLLNATLELGQGAIRPGPAVEPLAFETAKAYFSYDPLAQDFTFTDLSLDTAWGSFVATGQALLTEMIDGVPQAIVGQVAFSEMDLALPGVFETNPSFDQGLIDARLRLDPFSVDIGQAVLVHPDATVIASGTVEATDKGLAVSIDATTDAIAPETVVALWPASLARQTRGWISRNVADGWLTDAAASIRIVPDDQNAFGLSFGFEGSTIRFLNSLPPIAQAYGVASIHDNSFAVGLTQGLVEAQQGGQLNLAGTSFAVADTRLRPSAGLVDLQVESSITAALSILNQRPFEFLDKAGLPVTLAQGRAVTSGRLAVPLKPMENFDSVLLNMEADLSRVRADDLLDQRPLQANALRLNANRRGMSIDGPMRIGGVPAQALWSHRFGGPDQPGGGRVTATIFLSQQTLTGFGVVLPDGSIEGEARATVDLDLQSDGRHRFSVRSDLDGLRVAIPAIGWVKPRRAPGSLRLSGVLGPVPVIEDFTITGAELTASGRLTLTPAGGLDRAIFDRVQIADWLDAPITVIGRGPGRPVGVDVLGGRIDLRRASFGGGSGENGPMNITLDALQITQGVTLTGFEGGFRGQGGFRGEFTAQVNGSAPVSGTVAPRNGRSAVLLRSPDAGAALRAAGFVRTASGGALDLILLPATGEGRFDGTLSIRQIRLQDAPAMATLLDAISVVGLLQQLDGQGLGFETIDAAFSLSPSQLTLIEASAIGPGLGISADGSYDLTNQTLDLQGVVSPFFILNSIGSVFTRPGEGLIGFNYTVNGSVTAPRVVVNPLSALTPGMFREIFRQPPPDRVQ